MKSFLVVASLLFSANDQPLAAPQTRETAGPVPIVVLAAVRSRTPSKMPRELYFGSAPAKKPS